MNTFVIIPAYNEAKVIDKVVADVKRYVENVVVVSDGSTDDTVGKARLAGAMVLEHFINRGQGASLQTGTDYALREGADVVVHFDADGQMQASDIERLKEELLRSSHDIVLGSRFLSKENKMPCFKRVTHKVALKFHWIISGIRLTDIHSGFRVLTRRTASKIHIHHDRMAHATEIEEHIARLELTYKECPITVLYTSYSRSHALPFIEHVWEVVRDIVVGKVIKSK